MFPPSDELVQLAHGAGGYALAFILGALFGSFANVCIYRWPPTDEHPGGRSVVTPGSHCPACGHAIRWYDNLPMLGYLLLRGRCRDCGLGIAPRYPLVELLTAVLFVSLYHHVMAGAYLYEPLPQQLLHFVVLAAFAFVLVVIAFIDLDHRLILDKITYPGIPIFYGLGLLLERPWLDGLIGAALGYGVVRLLADGYRLLTGREGMGYGDGKLLALIGALFGWQAVLASLFLGSIIGSVLGITAIALARRAARGRDDTDAAPDAGEANTDAASADQVGGTRGEDDELPLRHVELPFGPFLVIGALVYVFVHPFYQLVLAVP
ncbi:prepilin peptidase [Haliangium ochraceum]|uniref:Prepilin leader peptidase/N-methyltransferase n=1 Tax=Haliangium ochraceum (strain DSM 14365 / JCM 11303 / SMP-2) TaxID=502025 RepID=D0LK34_HALO1|nr:A24 family peptidase [Haliangium ochraceum]ACY13068.1 peptidase A24A domain protein [Haliangium ochraceum DSM 14365]